MIDDSIANSESNVATSDSTTLLTPSVNPWVTYLSIIACIGIYLGLAVQNDYESWETVARFGFLPAESIWNGGYWGLATCSFVHFSFWHVALNLQCLWIFGRPLERAIGPLPFLAFIIVSAIVSSSFQLAVTGDTPIGASGVICAMFGFMLVTRNRYAQFSKVLDAAFIKWFLIGLVICVGLTFFKLLRIANTAHFSGLLFGSVVAGDFALRVRPIAMRAALITLVGLSIVPLYWCPWSVTWLSNKAYNAHFAGQYGTAIKWYTKVINSDPDNSWAYLNRSYIYDYLDKPGKANSDLQKAREIDPSIEVAN